MHAKYSYRTAFKNVSETEEVSANVTPGIVADYLEEMTDEDDPQLIHPGTTVADLMSRLRAAEGAELDKRKFTMSVDVEADIDINVELESDDVDSYLRADASNVGEVLDMIPESEIIEYCERNDYLDSKKNDSLHDDMKDRILEKAKRMYTVDELEAKLGVDWT